MSNVQNADICIVKLSANVMGSIRVRVMFRIRC